MKIDGFLKVPDIPGESVREGHEDEIEVHAFEFGMGVPSDPGSGARRGRVTLGPVRLGTRYDRSSPHLQLALFQNRVFDEVTLAIERNVDGEPRPYLAVTLTNASVVAYDVRPDAEQDGLLDENLALVYGRIRFAYEGHEVEMDVRPGR